VKAFAQRMVDGRSAAALRFKEALLDLKLPMPPETLDAERQPPAAGLSLWLRRVLCFNQVSYRLRFEIQNFGQIARHQHRGYADVQVLQQQLSAVGEPDAVTVRKPPSGKPDHGDLGLGTNVEVHLKRFVQTEQSKPGACRYAHRRHAILWIGKSESAAAEALEPILLAVDGRPRPIKLE
jgi:hypothetical protein